MKKAVDDLFDIYKKDDHWLLRSRDINSYISRNFDGINNFRTKFNEYYTSNRIGKFINKINPFTTTKEKFDMIDEFIKNKENYDKACLVEHAKYEEVNKNTLVNNNIDKNTGENTGDNTGDNTEYFISGQEDCRYTSIGKFTGIKNKLFENKIITQFEFERKIVRTETIYKLKSAIGGRRRKQTKKSKKSKRTRVLMKSRRRK